jgi:4-carboxymuconolactone decarboxylase
VTAKRPGRVQPSRTSRLSPDHGDRLLHLAETDEDVTAAAHGTARRIDLHRLDERTAALVRLAALVALRAAPASYRHCVDRALAAGASVDDVVDTLKVVARAVGLARVVCAAPRLALAVGYDIDTALETLDDPRADRACGPVRVVGGPTRGRRAGGGPAGGVTDPTA